MVGTVGTATSLSVQRYLNSKKVPQLLVLSGASKWNDPAHYPWSTAVYIPYQAEGRAYGRFILDQKPDAKIGILYQNDDGGKDFLIGLKEALGEKTASMIVKEISYEVSAPTVESQVILLKASGADVFINLATPKFAAQAIRRVREIGWKPLHIVSSFSSSIGTVLKPAGLDNAVGLISGQVLKTASDPAWKTDMGVGEYRAFIKEWIPEADPDDSGAATGYNVPACWLTFSGNAATI
jgi:ABC-type branched-subunit amino acid transport system substrate-binding protein